MFESSANKVSWSRGKIFWAEANIFWSKGQALALALREAALGDDHPDTGRTRSFLGTALLRQGRADAAGPELRRGLAIQRAGLDDGNPVLIPSLNGVAEWLIEAGDLGEAERVLQDALGLGDSLDPDHADIVETRRLLRSLRDAERAPR